MGQRLYRLRLDYTLLHSRLETLADHAKTVARDVLAGIPEHVEMRAHMMEKRMGKLKFAAREMRPPELWGPRGAQATVISWGSTQAAAREAVEILGEGGIKANSLEFSDLFPFPAEATAKALAHAKEMLVVEGNYTGQFHRLLRAETGIDATHHLFKYDGEPFYPMEIVKRVEEIVKRVEEIVRAD